MMRVLITDQFFGPSPYDLQQCPVQFETLVADMLKEDKERKEKFPNDYFTREAKVLDVADDFKPEWCTTIWRADGNGNAEVWKCKWDSSG